jgi:hypothetical protein
MARQRYALFPPPKLRVNPMHRAEPGASQKGCVGPSGPKGGLGEKNFFLLKKFFLQFFLLKKFFYKEICFTPLRALMIR